MSILTLLCALLLALLAAGCAFGGTAAESDPPEDLPSDMDTAALASQFFRDIVGAAESRNFYVTVDDGTATRLHIYPGNDFNVDGCQYTMDAHPWAATFSSQTPAGASLTLESADGSSLLRCWADSDLVLFQQDGRDSWATCSPVEGNLYDHLLCIPNDAVLQGVWNTPVSGALTDYQAVLRQFAQQAAAGLRDLPAWCLYRPLDAQPADVYVEDYYFGPGENFCGGFGLYLMLDNGESSPWQAGSGMEQVAEGPYAGYWSWRICASFARDEAGDWVCTGRYTGRANLIYPTPLDEATVAELLDDYFHTGGVAHDYRIPLELRRRTPEQLADLNALLDGYSSQEVQDFCTQMGFHLGEYPDYADLGYDEFAALLTGDWLAELTAGYQSATSLT